MRQCELDATRHRLFLYFSNSIYLEPIKSSIIVTVKKKLFRPRITTFEFSRNTQSWQCWHFCATSNVNKLETVKDLVYFKVSLHLSWCYKFLLMWWISLSFIFFKFRQYKNVNIANFVHYGKTRIHLVSLLLTKFSWTVFFFLSWLE